MNNLQDARETINEVDAEMARLFVRRMEAVRQVIAYKIEQDLPIYDAAREQAVLDRNCAMIADPTLSAYYRELLIKQMELSKRCLLYTSTDGLTPEPNDGKAFFGRDALANYMIIGSRQLGKEIFEVRGDQVTLNAVSYTHLFAIRITEILEPSTQD